jgi:hypothetical protein
MKVSRVLRAVLAQAVIVGGIFTVGMAVAPTTASAAHSGMPVYNYVAFLALDANTNGLGDGQNGDNIQLWSSTYAPNQQWYEQNCDYTSGGVYCEIVNSAHGLCLDASAPGDGSDGDYVQLWSCWGGANQLWRIPNLPEGPIWNMAHNYVLDANASGAGSDGDNVQLWQDWGGTNQMWWTSEDCVQNC